MKYIRLREDHYDLQESRFLLYLINKQQGITIVYFFDIANTDD